VACDGPADIAVGLFRAEEGGSALSEIDGKIVAEYGVNCRFCEEARLGLGRTRRRSEAVLRSMGWVKRRNRWFCDDGCAEKQAAADARAAGKQEGLL
jgi:hypothetical protein